MLRVAIILALVLNFSTLANITHNDVNNIDYVQSQVILKSYKDNICNVGGHYVVRCTN